MLDFTKMDAKEFALCDLILTLTDRIEVCNDAIVDDRTDLISKIQIDLLEQQIEQIQEILEAYRKELN